MTDLLETRKKGIPDPPHEVGLPDDLELSKTEEKYVLDALHDERFLQATTYQQQIRILHELLHSPEGFQVVSNDKIGKLFNPVVSPRAIYKRIASMSGTNGRPLLITNEECDIITEELKNNCVEAFPSIIDISDFIARRFDKYPSLQTIRNLFHSHRIPGFHIEEASPIEECRYNASEAEIREYYKILSAACEDNQVQTVFLFNLDESGQQDFVDARSIYIVVPDEMAKGKVSYPVDRSGKRITLLHCISIDGTSFTPLLVVPPKFIGNEVYDIINDKTVVIRS